MKFPRSITPFIFTFLTLLFVTKLEAKFFPLADEDSRWTYSSSNSYEVSPGFWQRNTTTYETWVYGDTLINDSLFHQIWTRVIGKTASGPDGNYDSSFTDKKAYKDIYLYEDETVGFFMVDTSNRTLIMVWDYNWEAGDTIPENGWHTPTELIVDSVGIYRDKGGRDRKQWFVSIPENVGMLWADRSEPASFISGIGTFNRNGGGFIHGFNIEGNGKGWNHTYLDCYGYKGQSVIRTCPERVLSIHEQQELSLELYPNPVTNGLLQLQTDFKGSLRLFNSQGKEVYQSKFERSKQEFDLRGLNQGLYMALIDSENGQTRHYKILIQ